MFDNPENKELLIISSIPDQNGWLPINYMIQLLSSYSNSKIIRQGTSNVTRFEKLKCYFTPIEKKCIGKTNILFIVNTASELNSLVTLIRKDTLAYNKISAWIIDSFWHDNISKFILKKYINHLFVMTKEDVSFYERKTKVPTTFLGWGTDVFNLGSNKPERQIDLLRMGRQPAKWNNDKENSEILSESELVYQGRPPITENKHIEFNCESYISLLKEYYSKSKFVLAQSNLVDDSGYTHNTREYITARWTDAIACGCVVLGYQPVTCSSFQQLWTESFAHIDDVNNIKGYIDEINCWEENIPDINYHMSLKYLDWRWKFSEIFNLLNIDSEKLTKDIDEIASLLCDFEKTRLVK